MRISAGVFLAVATAVLLIAVGAASAAGSKGRAGTLDPSFGRDGKVLLKAPGTFAPARFGSSVLQGNGDLVVELEHAGGGKGRVREIQRRLPDGSLDPSFGKGGGMVVGAGEGLARRPDGSIVVAVESCGPEKGSLLMLDPSGHPAGTWGKEGCGPRLELSTAHLAAAADGSVYIAGKAEICPCGGKTITPYEPAVARLLPDGSLDPAFGKGGVVRLQTDLGIAPEDRGSWTTDGMVVTAEGGVVIAAGDLLVGLTPGGGPATAFGRSGQVRLGLSAQALTETSDGRLVVAGASADAPYSLEPGSQTSIARFLPDGTPDPGFAGGGTLRLPQLVKAAADALAPAPDGAVILAGETFPARGCKDSSCTAKPFLARISVDGQLDPTYADGGLVELPAEPSWWEPDWIGPIDLATSAVGATFVTGAEFSRAAFVFARTPSGSPDVEFAEGGTLVERFGSPSNVQASGIALGTPRGQITIGAEGSSGERGFGGLLFTIDGKGKQLKGTDGGVSPTGARGEIVPIRGGFLSRWERSETRSGLSGTKADGDKLWRFGKKGVLALPEGFEARRIESGPAGGALVVGSMDERRLMAIYRVDADGHPVPGFGKHGLVKVSFGKDAATGRAATFLGKEVVVTGWVGGHAGAVKLTASGKIDRRFGHDGFVRGLFGDDVYGSQIVPYAGGVVIGGTPDLGRPQDFAGLVRLDPAGHRVRDFGKNGVVGPRVDGRLIALFSRHGRIVVVNDNEYERHSRGGVELRAYRGDGSPDTSYGRHGLATGAIDQSRYFRPNSAVEQPDGKIVVAGTAENGWIDQVEVMRFR